MTKRVDVCYVGKQEVLSEGLFVNNNKIEEIHIGGDIKYIPENCFNSCKELKKVVIECNLKSIEAAAFMNCENLAVINIPKSCKSIGDFAFHNCEKLKYVISQKSTINNIPIKTNNDVLLSVEIVRGLYYFEIKTKNHEILYTCKNLKEYKDFIKKEDLSRACISIKLSSYGQPSIMDSNGLFKNYIDVENIDISDLDASRFTNCSEMFAACYSLKEIKMPKNGFQAVKKLYKTFYDNCSLTKIDLSSSDLSNVEDMTKCFFRCNEVENIMPPKNKKFNYLFSADSIFSTCQKLTNIDLSEYNFPNLFNVDRSFYGCTNLKKLKLPKMKQKLFATSLFVFCNALTNLDIQTKLKLRFKSDFENIMISCPLEKIKDKYIEIAEE